jgi:ComF family protein
MKKREWRFFMKIPLGAFVRTVATSIVDVVYPSLCFSCGAHVPDEFHIICPACAASMRTIDRGDSLFTLTSERMCGDGGMDGLFSLYVFEKRGCVQSLLHQLKYSGATGIGRWMGEAIGRAIRNSELVSGVDAVIPVPLHSAKGRERGYNQSEHIAEGISRMTGLSLEPGLVRRIHHTQTQTALGIDERRLNMEGAFAVPRRRREQVMGLGLLLVDDVITTGATMRACAGALRAAGAGKIVACSVALADRTRQ